MNTSAYVFPLIIKRIKTAALKETEFQNFTNSLEKWQKKSNQNETEHQKLLTASTCCGMLF